MTTLSQWGQGVRQPLTNSWLTTQEEESSPLDSILNEPEFAQGLFNERVGKLGGGRNQRDYFKGQFNDFFDKFQLQLGRMFDAGQDTTQFQFGDFLGQQDFGNEWAGLSPDVAGRLTGRVN